MNLPESAPAPPANLTLDPAQIVKVAEREGKASKPKAGGRRTKEEDQLFGQRRQVRKAWHCIKLVYLIGFALIVLLSVMSLFWNSMAPEHLRWLNAAQLADAQKFLFSGTIGGVLTAGVSAALGKRRDAD